MAIEFQPLLTYADVAARMGVTHWAVRRWVRQGRLKCVSLGHRTKRITPLALAEFVRRLER